MQILDIIERIRPRPGMYLGTLSITRLRSFLDGYQMALFDQGVKEDPDDAFLPIPFACFHDYVALRLGYYESTSGWRNMILDQTECDEEKGFQLFFVLLDEFKQLDSTRFLAADLTEENKAHHIHHEFAPRRSTGPNFERSEPLYHDPTRVYYAKLAVPAKFECFAGIVETSEKYIFDRKLYKTEGDIMSFYEGCFGQIVWQPLTQNPFTE